jgi:hypothetical protein
MVLVLVLVAAVGAMYAMEELNSVATTSVVLATIIPMQLVEALVPARSRTAAEEQDDNVMVPILFLARKFCRTLAWSQLSLAQAKCVFGVVFG